MILTLKFIVQFKFNLLSDVLEDKSFKQKLISQNMHYLDLLKNYIINK